jgi:hypothetical protein
MQAQFVRTDAKMFFGGDLVRGPQTEQSRQGRRSPMGQQPRSENSANRRSPNDFMLQSIGKLKSGYETYEVAEEAAIGIKRR